MEYVKGKTLKSLLDRAQAKELEFSPEDCKAISFNILKAVDYLHKSNVLHRDLKPANILVQEDLSVKICDFGLSRTNPHEDEHSVPEDKSQRKALGHKLSDEKHDRKKEKRSLSPHVVSRIYRSPEIALLENKYSFSSDIWSVGCMVSEMMHCQSIYDQEGKSSVARYLFKSISCFPLSPCRSSLAEANKDAKNELGDLMEAIVKILGDQRKYDLSFLSSKKQKKYVSSLFDGKEKVKFAREFPESEDSLSEVVQHSLFFNPYFRYSAEMLQEFQVFSDLEKESCMVESKLLLQIDEKDAFDYEALSSEKYSIDGCLRILDEEIRKSSNLK